MSIDVIVLAAGQGSRMKSTLPKVMHPLAGQPLLRHVLNSAAQLQDARLHLVVGHGGDQLVDYIQSETISAQPIQIAWQREQLGTGHAVAQALPACAKDSVVLILYGDVPLTPSSLLNSMVSVAQQGDLALLTVNLADPAGYGRILRSPVGDVVAIVEHKDATDAQKAIAEVNTGIMAVKAEALADWLPRLSANNAQGEYYLTDIIAMAAEEGVRIRALQPQAEEEVQGVNTRSQLAALERWYQMRQAQALMAAGVSLADPQRFDLRGSLKHEIDISIDINCVFEGEVILEEGVVIGPNCLIRNSHIGAYTRIEANSVIEGAQVGAQATIGPFARLRPGTDLATQTRIGNFVEVKKSVIGRGSKVNHLSYIGDAQIGSEVNIGAGTITCNYDGVNKSLTEIEDGAFIGSNTALVAPVKVGANATVGAGSTLNKAVEAGQLAVARAKQRNLDNWTRPTKREK
ncbi:bifunctional UDP-N-acetylglucosamine diphosphorylase/glucosamine-1-phosphate N-acetyltransferase GlmU [Nitrincola tapanii]|uniref:Bifunctional protein GlmU n=1 Tax=Nitrincola tapanii TaxID=1708751 RepID=A0A5A9VZK4_9GAMM|nr:bifunctional UDP-N-acetylglucosamine diphosphorylase/glucosamine-1-phosphate N-acetyltransferase GlmU [Nitrincola tapanii]KAA0873742.1 UDP-N-acetylglucosamine diphosphorylase/glucosamine-1-phosphate N-acetyltransferase [Nitrincola tapanii]